MADPATTPPPPPGVSGYIESLKRDRDRFVALAFCAADLLIEIDGNYCITFAAGATLSLVGQAPEALIGTPFMSFIAEPDRALVRELVRGMTPGARLDPVSIRLNSQRGPTMPMSLMGYHLPDIPGCQFFAFRLGGTPVSADVIDEAPRDIESGLLERDAFALLASRQIREAGQRGEKLELTMVHTGKLEDFRRKLDEEALRSAMRTLGACLQANSAAGRTAGRLDDDAYGFLHRAGVDIDRITLRVEEIFRAADPEGKGIEVSSGTVKADAMEHSEADAKRALLYTVNRFCETDGADFEPMSLADNLKKLSEETSVMLARFRDVTDKGNFDIAFQPIISLENGNIHHFEALARFDSDIETSPYQLITFGEDTGIIQDFDLAMCARVLSWLVASQTRGENYKIAVNISGGSAVNAAFVSALDALLLRFSPVRPRLIFEITESAKIEDLAAADRFIQSLRAAGNPVCLDDFGAGSAALRYLHAFDIDIVKIDGQYVRKSSHSQRNHAFLRAVIGMCHDLGIETIAEMVEDTNVAEILRKAGVQYGQGYAFGKPSFDIETFLRPPPQPSDSYGETIIPPVRPKATAGSRKKSGSWAREGQPGFGRMPGS